MRQLAIIFTFAVILQTTFGFLPDVLKDYKTYKTNSDLGDPLIITQYLEDGRIEEAKAAAEVKLDVFQGIKSYSGFFNVDSKNDSNAFFWFFPSEDDYENDPVVLWVQGIVGFTVTKGIFLETGPFVVAEDGSLGLREYAWNKNQSVLYIDQPVAAGFSSTNKGYATDQTQVGDMAYKALVQFFTLFPELQQNDFFIAGEGYAGKYIPAIGYTIHQNNPTAAVPINLGGFLIGNGFCDPINQLNYGDLLYKLGLADLKDLEMYKFNEDDTIHNINKGNYRVATAAYQEITGYLDSSTSISSIYNYLKDNDDESEAWQVFLNRDDVRQAIHVGSLPFVTEDFNVFFGLYEDITKSVASWISELLDNYRILFYNGQLDISVNYILTVDYLQKLNFTSAKSYQKASRLVWRVNQEIAGFLKVAGNLTEVMVRNAGHFVTSDQPARGNRLIYYFTRGIPLE